MDARPIYMTAEQLGIEQWEHDGLVALVGPLSRGELMLQMAETTCDTSHCIGGWLGFFKGLEDRYVERDASKALSDLFYPGGFTFDFGRHWFGFCPSYPEHPGWNATAPQAARAIVNFLTLGDPRWDDVMRGAA